ncbi:MAG: hypothetical protein ACR5LG_00205 [Sodalis sp. (in: enterobacteria)]|uniref:hypothetical protein n=1 Tax=Sodalis sp. (in: enterobacteria) TaxID=1898979 RepID=UPI003F3DAE3C
MIDVTITVPDTLRQALERLSQSLRHRQPLMRTLGEDLCDAVMENFEQECRLRWLPIDRAGKILQQSGRHHPAHIICPRYNKGAGF